VGFPFQIKPITVLDTMTEVSKINMKNYVSVERATYLPPEMRNKMNQLMTKYTTEQQQVSLPTM
jgi:hypothetical protein